MLAAYLYYVKGHTKLNRQNHTLKNNPLGLVLWQGRVKMRSGLTLPKSGAKCNPLGLVFIYDCISPIIYANKSICQSSPPQNNPLGLVVYAFFRRALGRFERPTLRGCQFYYAPRQRWRCTSTLPYQKTNPDGVICERKCAIVDDFRRANVSLIFIYVKGNTKLNQQNYTLKNNPLGLVLWQGRVKMRSGLTLPKSSAKCNPLGLVFQIGRLSPLEYVYKLSH